MSKARILIIDDTPGIIHILSGILAQDYTIMVAKDGMRGIQRALSTPPPDIILLDIIMPEMNGYDVCVELKSHIETADIPVIFITVMGEEENEAQGFEVGAVDYITKPFNPEVVKARLQTHLELKQHRDELETLVEARTAELEQAKKTAEDAHAAKSRFLSCMSHELRTPMNGVVSMAELLLTMDLQDDQSELVEIIRSSAYAQLSVIEDILSYASLAAGLEQIELLEFSLTILTQKVFAMFAVAAFEKNIQLKLEINDSLPDLYIGDAKKLRQVLVHLVGNAIKFTPQGSVSLQIQSIEYNGRNITLEFAVIDTGIGIPANKHEALFQSFSQLSEGHSRRYGGTGIGLTNARELIHIMKGELKLESILEQGSRFYFSIPLNVALN